MSASRAYGQFIQRLEYNPRLFLHLLIFAGVMVFAYQFAQQTTSQWMSALTTTAGMVMALACLIWPFQAVMWFLGLSIWYYAFVRSDASILSLGSSQVYLGDVFIGAFLALEFFRGCMRQTHVFTSTDRWMLAYFGWAMVCVVRGVFPYGYSALGESREYLSLIVYFVTIHYVTRPEQTDRVLTWLRWICVITSAMQLLMIAINGFKPRYPGGNPLGEYAAMNLAVLGVLWGRDHITKRLSPLPVAAFIGSIVLVAVFYLGSDLLPWPMLMLGGAMVGGLWVGMMMLALQYRALAGIALLLQLIITLYGAQRGITTSMLVIIPFLAWVARRHFVKTMLIGVSAILGFVVLLVMMGPIFNIDLLNAFAHQYHALVDPSQDPTGSWRLYGWKWEMEKIFSNPFWVVIGQGFGGYYGWFFRLTDEAIRTGPHNQYIQIWSKVGLLGLILYFGAVIAFYMQGFRFLKRSRDELQRSIMMIFMLVVLGNQVNHIGGGFTPGMWVVIALGTALPRLWLMETPAPPLIHAAIASRRSWRPRRLYP